MQADPGRRFSAVRGRTARAIVANPDILSYFRFVLWVRVLRQMDVLQAALDATISPRIASVPRVGSIIGTRDSDDVPVSNTIESQLAVTT